ncbi:MAG: SAM-dependent methyltransferase, partial [Chlorobiota bacterium]
RLSVIESSTEIDEITDVTKFYQREIRTSDLPYNEKWSPIILSLFTEEKQPNGFCKISNYGMFTRGIATGANDFFALSKSKIEKWHLDTHNICKCITKSSHLRKSIFEEDDFNLLYQKDKPVYCLDVKDIDNVHVSNYLAEGERLGYHQRYLTKTRNTWYKIENRKPAPILFGVFQRGRLKVIRNYTSSINFTCFHSFYPNLFGEHIIDKLFIYFLSGIGQKIIKSNKRSYGDGLDKFEPGDLNESLCPNETQFEMIDESEVKKVFNLLEENEEEAIQMSNFLIKKILDSQTEVFSKSLSPSLYNY